VNFVLNLFFLVGTWFRVLLVGVRDDITVHYGDEVIPLFPTLLVCYVWLTCFVHYVIKE
jgi:hypothetical protein